MATLSLVSSTIDTNSGNKTVVATPAVNDLPIIVEFWVGGAISTNKPTDNNADGAGTYTLIAATAANGSTSRAAIFIRNAKIGSATSTTFTTVLPTNTGGGLSVYKAVGMTNVGSAAARQSATDSNDIAGATPAVTYASAASTSNAQIAAIINGTNAAGVTTPSGFTRGVNTGFTTPTTGTAVFTIDSGNTSTTLTWGGTSASNFGAVAVELSTGAAPPINTAAPVASGTLTIGSTLSCSTGGWTDDTATHAFAYQWQRDDHGGSTYSNIGAQTSSTYTLVDADDGCQVRCRVTDSDANGSTVAASNVLAAVRPVPTTSTAQTVTGRTNVGSTLTATAAGWTNMAGYNPVYTYQWQSAATSGGTYTNIASATSTSYKLTSTENTKYVRCNVTATNTGGAGTVASDVAGPVTAIAPVNTDSPEARTVNPRYNITMPRTIWDATCMGGSALYATTLAAFDGGSTEVIYKWADPTLPAYTSATLETFPFAFNANNALCYDSANSCLYAGLNITGTSGAYHLNVYKVSLDLGTITKIISDTLIASATGSMGGNTCVVTDGTYIYVLPNFASINSIVYKFNCSDGAYVAEYQIPNIGSDGAVGASELAVSGGYLYVCGALINRSNPPFIARIPTSTFNTSTQVQLTGFDYLGDDVVVAFGSLWVFDELTTLHPNGRFAKVALDLSTVTYVDTDVVGRGLDGLTADSNYVYVNHRQGDGLVYAYDPTTLVKQTSYSLKSGEADINDFYVLTGGFVSILTLPSPCRVVWQPTPIVPPPSTASVGYVEICSTGSWTDDGSPAYTYQWQRDTAGNLSYANIGGATTNTRTLLLADSGCHVRCVVTNTDVNGPTSANSQALLVGAAGTAPTNTTAPVVTGTTTVGQILTSTSGGWTDNGAPAFTYQWQRDTAGNLSFSNIGSATAATYTLVSGDAGNKVRCVVTDTDANGATAANSNAVGLVVTAGSTFVPIQSFTFGALNYRQDVTVVTTSDPAYLAVPQLFIASGGAKLANTSFVYRDSVTGRDRFIRKNKTHVSTSDTAYIAAPNLFS